MALPKIILIILILLILGLAAFFLYKNFFAKDTNPSIKPGTSGNTTTQPVEIIDITYWGLWEDGEILSEVFKDFEAQQGIRVDYRNNRIGIIEKD
jgi:ABC-type glycerol-3-phosphate transport system substrate-binding protein